MAWNRKGEPGHQGKLGYLTPALAPTRKATTRDFVWAAGVYEGEGSCSCRTGGSGNGLHVRVLQKDAWLPRQLRDLFGGSVAPSVDRRRGGSYWQWSIAGARARGFVLSIYSLLSPRRQAQIRKALLGEVN